MRRAAAVIVALAALGACGVNTDHHTLSAADASHAPPFKPGHLTVHQRDKVVLTVRNRTSSQRGFSIRGYPVKAKVDPGQTVRVRFTARRRGRFAIYDQLHPGDGSSELVVR